MASLIGHIWKHTRERERVNASHKELAQKVAWREYYIKDIFNISAGKRLTKTNMRRGRRPFIGATDNNNGITAYVSNDNASRDENILGVNYNGGVVENFYHPYECIFSDDVKRFSLKNYNGNKWVYLFLKVAILKQKEKYQYGYKFNERRMHEQKILLPAQPDGEPDYGFMENYAKNLEEKQLSHYVNYFRTV